MLAQTRAVTGLSSERVQLTDVFLKIQPTGFAERLELVCVHEREESIETPELLGPRN